MNADKEYFRLLDLILTKGKRKKNRTGTDTIGVFGAQARFDLSTFPLLTTKRMAIKSITHELLWFIKGDTNIKYLVDNGCNIWNDDCYRRYLEQFKAKNVKIADMNSDGTPYEKSMFVHQIKTFGADSDFVKRHGDLGEGTYGQMWRAFPYAEYWEIPKGACYSGSRTGHKLSKVDQLSKVIEKLKTNPDDRRMIVSAWHPYWVDHCALPPCHCLFHFNTEELTREERWDLIPKYNWDTATNNHKAQFCKTDQSLDTDMDSIGVPRRRLNCLLYQRSCDTFLGVPFNIASYGMLTSMVAQSVNMLPGEFIHTYGDLHLYQDHLEQAKLQLTREPYPLPTLWLNPEVKSILDFKFEDIRIDNYQSHPAIKADLSVG